MRHGLGVLLGLAVCLTAARADTNEWYLKIDGIAGNAVWQSEPGWIRFDGYSVDKASLEGCDGWVTCFHNGKKVALIVRRTPDAISAQIKAAADDGRLLSEVTLVEFWQGGGALTETMAFGEVRLSDYRVENGREIFLLRFGSIRKDQSLIDEGPPIVGVRSN